MIEIENLYLTIKGKEIFKGIELHFKPGDTFVVYRSFDFQSNKMALWQ